ncbi:MAG: hypothetical protein AAF433_13330 [Bacteroidota bacterium]
MKKNSLVNAGGINGLGESLINLNSESFRGLQAIIMARHADQTTAEKLANRIISLRFQMESYLAEEQTDTILPAGYFIEQLLQAASISKKRFAEYIS